MSGITRKFKGKHIIEQNQNIVRAVNALLPIAKELDQSLSEPFAVEQLELLKKGSSELTEFVNPRATYSLTLEEAKACNAFPTLTTAIVFSNLDGAIRELFQARTEKMYSKLKVLPGDFN